MSTKNFVLGACATCLAVGSAFATLFNTASFIVKNGSHDISVTGTACPTPNSSKCIVKVRNKANTATVFASKTLYSANGVVTLPGSGLIQVTVFTTGS